MATKTKEKAGGKAKASEGPQALTPNPTLELEKRPMGMFRGWVIELDPDWWKQPIHPDIPLDQQP